MKNILRLGFILVLAYGCASKAPVKTELTNIISNETKEVNFVKVLSTKGFTEKEEQKLLEYIPVMNNTIASECFDNFIQARPGLHSTQNKSAAEVVQHLRTSTVEIHLITYYKRFSRVHGYTYPNVNKVWLNRKYHAGASLCSEASNLAHELSHKLGYTHSYKASKIRPFSVPYSINAAFKACCK
jgi:hypothetical protein